MKSTFKLNGKPLEFIEFRDGAIQLKTSSCLVVTDNLLDANIKDNDGLIALMQIKSIFHKDDRVVLNLKYLPYSRYDRSMTGYKDPLSLKIICNLINSLEFDQVCIDDCHSDVGLALLNNVSHIEQVTCVQQTYRTNAEQWTDAYDFVIAPDAGASKKAFKVAQSFGIPMIQCLKIRDVSTGDIVTTKVLSDGYDLQGAHILVVDDICEGGATFIPIANELQLFLPASIDLYVTHGMFTKGIDHLEKVGYNKFYTHYLWNHDIAEVVNYVELF